MQINIPARNVKSLKFKCKRSKSHYSWIDCDEQIVHCVTSLLTELAISTHVCHCATEFPIVFLGQRYYHEQVKPVRVLQYYLVLICLSISFHLRMTAVCIMLFAKWQSMSCRLIIVINPITVLNHDQPTCFYSVWDVTITIRFGCTIWWMTLRSRWQNPLFATYKCSHDSAEAFNQLDKALVRVHQCTQSRYRRSLLFLLMPPTMLMPLPLIP